MKTRSPVFEPPGAKMKIPLLPQDSPETVPTSRPAPETLQTALPFHEMTPMPGAGAVPSRTGSQCRSPHQRIPEIARHYRYGRTLRMAVLLQKPRLLQRSTHDCCVQVPPARGPELRDQICGKGC